jgi:ubiquitin-conjugating enzyme E2 S
LVLSSEFPRVPPKGYFFTKIFHPNVSEKGEICVNTLKKDWDPMNWSLQHVFEVIRCLLIVPFPESSLNEEAGKLFMEDYEEYAKHARLITELYALPKTVQPISSPLEKPSTAMDIENTQEESPKKPVSGSMNTGLFTFDTQLIKQNSNDSPFGMGFKTDEVLMTVTNSLNTNPLSPADDSIFKKGSPAPSPFGNMMGTGMGLQVNTNPRAAGNESISAKKENEKKWKKRI